MMQNVRVYLIEVFGAPDVGWPASSLGRFGLCLPDQSAAGEVLSEPLGYSMLQLCNSSRSRSMCGNEGGYLALLLNHFCSTAPKGSEDQVLISVHKGSAVKEARSGLN